MTAEKPFSDAIFAIIDSDTNEEAIASEEEKENEDEEEGLQDDDSLLQIGPCDKEDKDKKEKDDLSEDYVYYGSSFCSYYMDQEHIIVIKSDYLNDFLQTAMKKASFDVIESSRYGNQGFFLEVFGEGEEVIGPERIVKEGTLKLPKNILNDGYSGFININKDMYFCTVLMEGSGKSARTLLCAIPVKELRFSVIFISITTLAAVLVSLILMRSFAQILALEASGEKNKNVSRNSYRYRLTAMAFICICATVAISIYSQILYRYSFAASVDVSAATDIQNALESFEKVQESGSQSYKKVVRVFCNTAESLISEKPEFQQHEKIKELADLMGADHILVYNESGIVTASDMNFNGLALSKNPKDLSNEFFWVIRGQPFLIQDEIDKVYMKEPHIFAGVPLKDQKGDYFGMVQVAIDPAFRSSLVYTTSLETILSTISESKDTTAVAIDTDTKTIISADKEYNGLKLEELGVSEKILRDEFIGFLTIQEETMMGCCKAMKKYWLVVVSEIYRIPLDGVKSGMMTAIPGIVSEILYFLVLLFDINRYRTLLVKFKLEESEDDPLLSLRAEERILTQLSLIAIIFSTIITFILLAGSTLFKKNTIGYFIFVYPWPKGFNVFTLTRCLTYICVAALIMFVLNKILTLLASLLASRQETVIRLVLSFLKYFSWIAVICFCLNILGLPTASLLASAGALTVIFSIGAQSIVADILAGLFIIFEGSFRVGDMITVDDWHGQVMEIGIRNTTIRDLIHSDVKIMNNSTIKKVINFSRYPSLCKIIIGTEYDADIRELEAIIEKERKTIKENIPQIIGEFRYLGVESFGDSAVYLKFEGACLNQDFEPVKRKINRELKLMFDRNGITVPFTQVVIHQEK